MMYDIEQEKLEERIADSMGIDVGTLRCLDYGTAWTESIFPELVVTILSGSDPDTLEDMDLSVGDEIRIDDSALDSIYDYVDFIDSDIWLDELSDKYQVFLTHMNSVQQLVSIPLGDETQFHLLVMLHTHVVAATESYLASTYISHVVNNRDLMQKSIESDPHFREQKIPISDIFKTFENIKETCVKRLKDIIFHRIHLVKPMYKSVFNYDFGNVGWLFSAVEIRHHCAHRAGFDKDGAKVEVTVDSIIELAQKSRDLCYKVEMHVQQFSDNKCPDIVGQDKPTK
jgi:glycosyltransferase involved in cell wall biosynthesis